VPVLWDKEKKTIVNNESMDIIGILNSEFEDLAKNASLDLCPADMKDKLDELNSWIYPNINNVRFCGLQASAAC
jgi:glutathionyl-hydroquinone reductase